MLVSHYYQYPLSMSLFPRKLATFTTLQNILTLPQSGHTQVGPLLMPHMFSLRQLSQIWKPHGQFQQKGSSAPQQWHL